MTKFKTDSGNMCFFFKIKDNKIIEINKDKLSRHAYLVLRRRFCY